MASDGNANHSRWFATKRATTISHEMTLTKLTTTNRDVPGAVRLHDGHGNVFGNPPSHRIDGKATMMVVSNEKGRARDTWRDLIRWSWKLRLLWTSRGATRGGRDAAKSRDYLRRSGRQRRARISRRIDELERGDGCACPRGWT
ncbi:hypothetical protein Sjap_025832 [Stephania japonica]|uniref:Uncharacterized protein n=1 Tax=Stephania japonica TaxID=461633 RepID=A0AAP0E2H3_9MAGN